MPCAMTDHLKRPDGRHPDELRPAHFVLDYVEYPEGSVLIEVGRTRVLCNVGFLVSDPRSHAGAGGQDYRPSGPAPT